MVTKQPEQGETKGAVSVSEMAGMVGLSRQRFHQLMKEGVFPPPSRDEASGRPFYDEDAQRLCLEVRRRNCGVNGQVVLFYARRQGEAAPKPRPAKVRPPAPVLDQHADILDGVRALGLGTATPAQVAESVRELFPAGVDGVDLGQAIRAVFMRLRVENSAEKVGRKE